MLESTVEVRAQSECALRAVGSRAAKDSQGRPRTAKAEAVTRGTRAMGNSCLVCGASSGYCRMKLREWGLS